MKKQNKLFETCLSAVYKGDEKGLIHCIKSGFDIHSIDADGRTILFYAILENSISMVGMLIKAGADVNVKDKNSWAPLHYAAQDYLIGIAELLIDNGADVNAKDGNGNTVIWRAVFSSQGRGEMITMLKAKGADATIENDSGINALKLAKSISNYDVAQYFTGLGHNF